jgi:hypothetical protein
MNKYEQVGRDLHITLTDVDEPFIIKPLPGYAGEHLTRSFIEIAAQQALPEGLVDVWQMSVDGVLPGETSDGNPIPIVDGPNYSRVKNTLSLSEGEAVVVPAFYWQTTLGIEGIKAFTSGGEGLAGSKKALELLIWTLGISPTQTGRSSALEILIQSPGLTPLTPRSTTTVDKLPPAKRGFMQNRRARRAAE